MHGQANIHYHSKRYRLTDPGGACSKYTTDALVTAKILRGDSTKEVKGYTHSQEKVSKSKGETEETIITLEWK